MTHPNLKKYLCQETDFNYCVNYSYIFMIMQLQQHTREIVTCTKFTNSLLAKVGFCIHSIPFVASSTLPDHKLQQFVLCSLADLWQAYVGSVQNISINANVTDLTHKWP